MRKTTEKNIKEVFEDKIIFIPFHSCWEWSGYHEPDGYSKFKKDGQMRGAHRVSYELYVGSIPKGLEIDHLCRNRGCVNPSHLGPKTRLENLMAPGSLAPVSINKKKTFCKRGHEFNIKNTHTRKNNTRLCRRCDNLRRKK